MQRPLKRQDFLTLNYIVESAHKKYLNESRISKTPAFNILRVLSSFKQIFPTTPDRLYKLIILITKNHNPQTFDQWTRAIQKLNSPSLVKNSHSLININSHSLVNLNQSSIRQAQSRIFKQKQNENSIKTYKEELDHEIECIESKRSRMKFVGDFRVTEPSWMAEQADENKQNNMEYSNKNSLRNSQHAHLISFEPTHKDSVKQNAQKLREIMRESSRLSHTQKCQLPKQLPLAKKINPYHQITKIDNLSYIQDREPTSKDESKTMYSHNTRTESNSRMYFHSKTPRDNSFVRVMALDSKDSYLSVGKSGEIMQCQEYSMGLEQWEQLNDRAHIFAQFNSKLKAFSALLANYQAFQTDRYLKNKADIFHACYLETKAFIGLKSNVLHQQECKQKLNKSQHYHHRNLTQKVWKVLQLLRNLKIQGPNKTIEVQKLNRINFQFLLSFMFEEKTLSESSPDKYFVNTKNNNCMDFDRKVQYFSQTQNFDNVWNIYKCFGLNISMSKEQLTQFFKNYHHCLQKNTFSLLKKNLENNKYKYLQMHEQRLIEKAFAILLGKKQVAKQHKLNQYRAQSYAHKKLKQKAYHILLSIVYSTKIFSKRQQFIEAQKMQKTKIQVMRKWISEYKIIQLKKNNLSKKLQSFASTVTKFMTKLAFRSIKHESKQIQEKISFSNKFWELKTLRKVLSHFQTLLQNKKKYINLCETNQIQFQKKILTKWLKAAKVSSGLRQMSICCNKIVFRKLFVPLSKAMVKNYLMSQEEQKNLVKECFEALKTNLQQNEAHRNECIQTIAKVNQQIYAGEFMQSLKLNRKQKIHNRETQLIKSKQVLLQCYLDHSLRQRVCTQLRKKHSSMINSNETNAKLKQLRKHQSLSLLIKNTLQDINLNQNSFKLAEYLKQRYYESVIYQMKRAQTQNRTIVLHFKTQKSLLKKFVSSIQQRYQDMLKIKQMAENHYTQVASKKVLYSLAQNFIQITNKTHDLEKTLKIARFKEYYFQFVVKTRKQVVVRQNCLSVLRIQPFSCLRQNLALKKRQHIVRQTLRSNQIQQTFESLANENKAQKQKKCIKTLSSNLKHTIFWFRFNNDFISTLLNKKHVFMAYKFRALKLYGTAFSSWKQIVSGKRAKKHEIQQVSNQQKRQMAINIKKKEFTQMYKQTDCE